MPTALSVQQVGSTLLINPDLRPEFETHNIGEPLRPQSALHFDQQERQHHIQNFKEVEPSFGQRVILHDIHNFAKNQSDSVLETEENPQELNISSEAKMPTGED